MALPLFSDPIRERIVPSISSGGILWRRRATGQIEVCLARNGDRWSIPRGAVLEDERLEDAAARHVLQSTSHNGRVQRRFGRVELSPGEFAYFFLLRSREVDPPASGCSWVPLPSALRVVSTEGERVVLLEVLDAIGDRRL